MSVLWDCKGGNFVFQTTREEHCIELSEEVWSVFTVIDDEMIVLLWTSLRNRVSDSMDLNSFSFEI